MQLTDKQKHVLNFIAKFIRENGYAPTSREVKDGMGMKWQTNAVVHLNALRKKGRISWVAGKGRTITILEPK